VKGEDKDEKGSKEDTSDNNSVVSAGSSSGSGVERGVKSKNQEWQNAGGLYTAHDNGKLLDGLNKCVNSRDKGIEEVLQFIDSDDKWRKCLLIDSD
jgi:hypothetical protein